ncbi:hypothetical protein HPB47_027411 [Ixodes persulcatus]|uniref:Uncharacterized protein n=1 Tax=Ixodes persulcatus TaxID=34615 RepID=A0AC60PW20_IXOPE|nr:hypothetical protein HPB47_027411 [Ixodes persulcatus]
MSTTELQEEEVEVLLSIYDGDENFKKLSPTVFQYKIGDQGSPKSFLFEVSWPERYPNEMPNFNLETFYNKHLAQDVKDAIVTALKEQAELELGTPMTYTLLEWAKEHADELTERQPEQPAPVDRPMEVDRPKEPEAVAKKEVKQPKLSKSQKRKLAGRLLPTGELPRGHDWVDVVKHLSQTGTAAT